MKKILYLMTFCSLCSFFVLHVRSQTGEVDRANREMQRQELDRERRMNQIWTDDNGVRVVGRYSAPAPFLDKKTRDRIRQMREVDPADREKYHDLLEAKNTGIFRLFPDADCITKIPFGWARIALTLYR